MTATSGSDGTTYYKKKEFSASSYRTGLKV